MATVRQRLRWRGRAGSAAEVAGLAGTRRRGRRWRTVAVRQRCQICKYVRAVVIFANTVSKRAISAKISRKF